MRDRLQGPDFFRVQEGSPRRCRRQFAVSGVGVGQLVPRVCSTRSLSASRAAVLGVSDGFQSDVSGRRLRTQLVRHADRVDWSDVDHGRIVPEQWRITVGDMVKEREGEARHTRDRALQGLSWDC